MDSGCTVCLCDVCEGFSLSVTFQVKLWRFHNNQSTWPNKCVRQERSVFL